MSARVLSHWNYDIPLAAAVNNQITFTLPYETARFADGVAEYTRGELYSTNLSVWDGTRTEYPDAAVTLSDGVLTITIPENLDLSKTYQVLLSYTQAEPSADWTVVNTADAEYMSNGYSISAQGNQLTSLCGTEPAGEEQIRYYFSADGGEWLEFKNTATTVTFSFQNSVSFFCRKGDSIVNGETVRAGAVGGTVLGSYYARGRYTATLPEDAMLYRVYTDSQTAVNAKYVIAGTEVPFASRLVYQPYTPAAVPSNYYYAAFINADGYVTDLVKTEAGELPAFPTGTTAADWTYDADAAAAAADGAVVRFTAPAAAPAVPTHTVSFYADGYLVASYELAEGDLIVTPALPEKIGHTGTWDTVAAQMGDADLTYTAHYEKKSYNVDYNTSDGGTYTAQVVTYGDTEFRVQPFNGTAPEGKKFVAWQAQDGAVYIPGLMHTYNYADDSELYPIFAANTEYWLVSFADEDGAIIKTELVEQSTTATVAAPAYGDYTGAKWSDGATSYAIGANIPVTGNATLTADMSAYITLTFLQYPNGPVLKTLRVVSGTGVALPTLAEIPARTGWEKSTAILYPWKGNGYGYAAGGTTNPAPTTDTVYSFQGWTKATYRVFYALNAEGTTTMAQAQEVKYEESFTTRAFTGTVPDGKSFLGWKDGYGNIYLAETAYRYSYANNMNLIPVFADNTEYWIVNFIGEGGSYGTMLVKQAADAEVTLPTYAPYPGATWTKQGEVTEYSAGAAVPVTGDTAFMVKAPALCTVTFKAKDGSILKIEQLRAGESPTAPAAPVLPGHEFLGWHCADDAPDAVYDNDAIPAVAASRVYQAEYLAAAYTVTGTASCTISGGAVQSNVFGYGEQVTVTLTVPDGSELNFITATGAETDKAIPVVKVADNLFRFEMPAEDVNVAATFAEKTYRVIFKSEGTVLDIQEIAHGYYAVEPTPEREGYSLVGWIDQDGRESRPNEIPAITGDTILVAVWGENIYEINIAEPDVITTDKTNAAAGEIVNITVDDEYGYDTLYVLVKALNPATGEFDISVPVMHVDYEPAGFVGWQFTMPAANVLVLDGDTEHIYDVQFKDGSSLLSHQSIQFEGYAVEPTPEKAGWTLVGWNDGTDIYELGMLPEVLEDVIYTAVWEQNSYAILHVGADADSITDNAVDGKAVAGQSVTVTLTPPVGSDLNFITVVDADNNCIPVCKIGNLSFTFTMPASMVGIIAIYTPHIYDVQFKNDDATLLSHQSVAFENAPVEPVIEKEGYTLIGWDNGEAIYAPGDAPVATADVIYTAVWEAIDYNVWVLDENVTADKETAKLGEVVTVTVNPVEGYDSHYVIVFKDSNGNAIAVTRLDQGIYYPENVYQFTMPADSVYVVWAYAEHIYDIQFKDGETLVSHQDVPFGAMPQEPAIEKEGYTLIGWTDGEENFYAVGEIPEATADVIYTAVWEANLYNLTYYRGVEADESEYKCILELPDGTLVEFFNNDTFNMPTYVVADVPYGEQVELGKAFLPGYVFLYWKDEAGHRWDAGELFTMPEGGELLTAVWEEETMENCLVRFLNEGKLYDAYLAYVGTTQYIPETDPSEDGREFIGWEYDGYIYANDRVPEFLVVADENRDMVFTAVWSDYTYTVSFTGENVDLAPLTDVPYGEEIVLPAAPEREGFTFVAWVDVENGAFYGESALYTVKRDATLNAVWSEDAVEYAVKFFDEKGNLVDLLVVPAGEIITAPAYEQGRKDCTYVWVDEAAHLHYFEGEDITVNAFLNFRATKLDEATYPVTVEIIPDTIPTGAAAIDNDTYFMGDTVYVDITVPEGYVLKNVTAYGEGAEMLPVKDGLLTYIDGIALYFFEMPAAPIHVFVEFEEIPVGSTVVKFLSDGVLIDYRIVTRGTNGTTPETVPVKDGYTFLYWQSGSTIVGAGEPFAVAADAPDEMIFEAVWEQQSYMVSYDTLGGVPQPAPFDAVYGEQITLAAAPFLEGFRFVGWVEDSTGFLYGESATYTVKGVVSFTARWEIIPPEEYIVKFIDEDTNQIFGYEIVEEGETVTAPSGPSFSGLTFVAWEDEGGAQLLPGNQTQPIHADTVYVATYRVNTHSIFTATESCEIQPAAFGTPEVGSLITFSVNPIDRFTVTSVTISYMDGPALTVRTLTPDADGNYSFYMPDSDVTITAAAAQNVFSIFTRADANSSIDAPIYGVAGETVFFEAAATNPDYELNNVIVVTANESIIPVIRIDSVDGTVLYAFEMPAADVRILTSTVKAEYTVTYLDSDNTLLGIVPVNSGEYAEAPEASKDGYVFDGWELLPSKAEFDPATDAVTENLIVRATYIGEPFTVAAGKADHVDYLQAECTIHTGNLNSSNLLLTEVLNAETGKTVYFTVAAEYDYVITDIAVVSAEGTDLVIAPVLREKRVEDNLVYYTYAFDMPAENVLIDVYTAPKFFKASVIEDIPEGGEYTINGYYTSNLMIPQGEEVVIAAVANEGYYVAGISGTYIDNLGNVAIIDGVFDDGSFTFTMIAKDVNIVIDYEPIIYGIDIQTSNAETYKPDASQNPAKVIESLDDALTSKGRIDLVDGALVDFTNAAEQVYKIPANGEAIIGERIAFTVTEYVGYDLDSVSVTYDNGEKTCPLTYKDGVYYFDMPADDVIITAIFVEETYKVYKDETAEAHGKVVMNGLSENSVSADYKDVVDVLVTPDDGYQIVNIYYVLGDGSVLDFDAAQYTAAATLTDALDTLQFITFHMPATDVMVYVEYAPIDYTIKDICEEATATYETPHTVGEQVSFETKANYGYIITGVYAINEFNGEKIALHTDSTNTVYGAEYFFTMPAAPVTIHVETIEDTYNVIYLDNGSFIAAEDVDYLDTADVAGHVADVVNGKPGYHFVGWISAEVQTPVTVPSVDNADFVIVAKTIIRAAYEKDEIDVLFKATENGTVTEKSTGNTAEYRLDTTVFGDKVTFTAEPAVGYVVDTVSVTSTNAEGYNLDIRYTVDGNAYTFTIPATFKSDIHDIQAEDVIVTVTFKKDAYTLTRADGCETDGTISVNGAVTTQTSFTYEYQDEVSITATPKPGYYVAGIVAKNADGSEKFEQLGTKPATDTAAGAPLTLSFKMPDCDLTYTVDYEKLDYSITTVFDATQGTVETAPANIAQLDDLVTVTVTPKVGYDLVSLTATYDNGESSLLLTEQADGTYTFTMPAQAMTVTAIFTESTYTANLTVIGEADATLNGYFTDNMTADYLDTVTINVAPALGWELVSITIDEGAIKVNEEIKPEGGNYTFTMPNKDVDITVRLEKTGFGMEAYALNFYEDGHGEVTLSPEDKACVGDRIVISADPDDGYRVKEVVVIDEYGYAVPVSFIGGTPGYIETYSFTMPAFNVKIFVYFEVQGSSFYTDVRTDFWFYEAVTFVTDRGYFKGITPELFAPYKNMDRAMFVTVLGRISDIDTSKFTGIAFTDVEAGSYYAPYVAWAAENDIVLGKSATIFDPHADITRQEMAAIMYRYCKYLGADMTLENQMFMDRYEDVGDISPWAAEYVKWAVGVGLIRGMSPTTIDPLGYASRAQVAQIIKNLCDKTFYQ